jgi:2-polyprenyl-3-methyl-5-hydroxy-6-metoxy-1,4-benzoquinol methylase
LTSDATSKQYKDDVLRAFSLVSPSAVDIEDPEIQDKYSKRHVELFRYRLNFPPELFNNRSVIDFGCGTGEFDNLLSTWGASVIGFDFNVKSIERALRLKAQLTTVEADRLEFLVGDVDTFAIDGSSYDIAVSMGVLPHVPDQYEMFSRMAHAIRPGGYLILGYIEDSGLIQRLLHRAIITAVSTGDDSDTHRIARMLFGEHISRSVRAGNRSAASIINDYLVNPHYDGISSQRLDMWAQRLGLRYYSTWPQTYFPFSVDSPDEPIIPRTTEFYQTYLSLHRLRWMFASHSDWTVFSHLASLFSGPAGLIEQIISVLTDTLQGNNTSSLDLDSHCVLWDRLLRELNDALDATSQEILTGVNRLSTELIDILRYLNNPENDDSWKTAVPETEDLFRGYNGLGTTYTIWHKI